MKIPTLKTDKSRLLHIDALDGGISLKKHHTRPHLSESLNMWYKDGVLKTRPALKADTDCILEDSVFSDAMSVHFSFSSTQFIAEEDTKHIVVEDIAFNGSSHFLLTHFISSDGTPWKSARMDFNRVSDDSFYIPENAVFIKADPKEGCGLFAFVALVNCEDYSQTESRIYELSQDYTQWEAVISAYIPTVYINGRGNKFYYALASGQAFEEEPRFLEKLNLLSNEFYAYYSTDGCSSVYRLPFSELSDERVTARLYYSIQDYTEWIVEAGETSAEAEIFGANVTLTVNRPLGTVYFSMNGEEYAIPLIDDKNENNLRFSASKACEWNRRDICLSAACVSLNGNIILAKGNTLFSSTVKNPLYFPLEGALALDDEETQLNSLTALAENIFAFSPQKTFKVDITSGRALNSHSLLAENDSIFYSNPTLKYTCFSENTGCREPSSVITEENRIFWQGGNGHFYTVGKSSVAPLCISGDIPHLILSVSDGIKTVGLRLNGYLMFIIGHKALCLGCEETTFKENTPFGWYYWELPSSLYCSGGFCSQPNIYLIMRNTDEKISFVAELKGERDSLVTFQNGEYTTLSVPVKASFKTQSINFGCGNAYKNIICVSVSHKGAGCRFQLNDRPANTTCGHFTEMKPLRLTAGLSGVGSLSIGAQGDRPFEIGDIDIKYIPLERY